MARITNGSLILVQTGELKHSIPALQLKEYTSPKAVQPNRNANRDGKPGVMFPSQESFDYDPMTGKLSLKNEGEYKEQVGYIGYEQNLPPDTDVDDLPMVVKPTQSGAEMAGQFYTVIDPDYKYLTNDWGTGYYDADNPAPSNIMRVKVGDEVYKEPNGDWKVRQNYVQGLYMYTKLNSYPHISQIKNL